MVKIEDFPKDDYLAIPIEMYKCEIIIRKNRKLSELEKLSLKYIHKESSLKEFIYAFNASPYIMNNILAKLFYRGLVQLKLDQGLVQLNKKIVQSVEDNKLDDYFDEAPVFEKRNITLIQEKIGGEIFTENNIRDFLKNPGELTTNYFDLKATAPEKFPNLMNLSLGKYIKCIRSEFKADPEDIEKINFIKPLHKNRLYIPLSKSEERKVLDLDYEIFPKHAQKAWQTTYESEYNIKGDKPLDLLIREPQFISSELFKIHFLKNLILLEDDLKSYYNNKNDINLKQELEENIDTLENLSKSFSEKIYSMDNYEFIYESDKGFDLIKNCLLNASKSIIICSTYLDSGSIAFFEPIIKNIIEKDIIILFLWANLEGNSKQEAKRKVSEYRDELVSKIDRDKREKIYILHSNIFFDSNFILVDFSTLIFSNCSFMSWNFSNKNVLIPTIKINGGTVPLGFLEFISDFLPIKTEIKDFLDSNLIKCYENIRQGLSKDRIEIVGKFQQNLKDLKTFIHIENLDGIKESIIALKNTIKKIDQFDYISIISDMDHDTILVDAMKEINNEYILFTNDISKDKIGPNFRDSLKNVKRLSIYLNKLHFESDESKFNLGISKLEMLKKSHNNLNYEVHEKDYLFNCLFIKENLIIFTNYKFLSHMKRIDHRFNLKCLGLVIYSKKSNINLDFF